MNNPNKPTAFNLISRFQIWCKNDNIANTEQLYKGLSMVCSFINAVIIISLIVYVCLLYQTKISDEIKLFDKPCIQTTSDGTKGFKNIAQGIIVPCDPSNNSAIPNFLQSAIAGKPIFDLPSTPLQTASTILIICGIILNILFIFLPYLFFIKDFIKFLLKFLYFKCETSQDKKDFDEKLKNLEKSTETSVEPIGVGGSSKIEDNTERDKMGGGLESIFKYAYPNIIEHIGGNGCDKGDIFRLFLGGCNIVIILVLGTMLEGNPLSISPGLLTLGLSIMMIFRIFGSITPSTNEKKEEEKKNSSHKYYLLSIILLILSIGWLIFLGVLGKFHYLNPYTILGVVTLISSIVFKLYSRLNVKHETGDEEVINMGVLAKNYIKNMNNSVGLGLIQLFIVIVLISFMPNFNEGIIEIMQNQYTYKLGIFITICVIYLMIFTIVPLLQTYKILKNLTLDNNENIYDICGKLSFLYSRDFKREKTGCLPEKTLVNENRRILYEAKEKNSFFAKFNPFLASRPFPNVFFSPNVKTDKEATKVQIV